LRDVSRREGGRSDLVEERLKEVIVVAVDDQQLYGRAAQRSRGEQAAEAAADDHDPGKRAARVHAEQCNA
jgi:hypothetical protein